MAPWNLVSSLERWSTAQLQQSHRSSKCRPSLFHRRKGNLSSYSSICALRQVSLLQPRYSAIFAASIKQFSILLDTPSSTTTTSTVRKIRAQKAMPRVWLPKLYLSKPMRKPRSLDAAVQKPRNRNPKRLPLQNQRRLPRSRKPTLNKNSTPWRTRRKPPQRVRIFVRRTDTTPCPPNRRQSVTRIFRHTSTDGQGRLKCATAKPGRTPF